MLLYSSNTSSSPGLDSSSGTPISNRLAKSFLEMRLMPVAYLSTVGGNLGSPEAGDLSLRAGLLCESCGIGLEGGVLENDMKE